MKRFVIAVLVGFVSCIYSPHLPRGSDPPGLSTQLPRPNPSIIVPGRSVGPLKLGESMEEVYTVFPFRSGVDQIFSAGCGVTEFHWVDLENDSFGLSLLFKGNGLYQIETATTRFRLASGVTLNRFPAQVRKEFPAMQAFVLFGSGSKINGGRDLVYWVDKSGIAFELYYDKPSRGRRIHKIIVFDPAKDFLPGACVENPIVYRALPRFDTEPPEMPWK